MHIYVNTILNSYIVKYVCMYVVVRFFRPEAEGLTILFVSKCNALRLSVLLSMCRNATFVKTITIAYAKNLKTQ